MDEKFFEKLKEINNLRFNEHANYAFQVNANGDIYIICIFDSIIEMDSLLGNLEDLESAYTRLVEFRRKFQISKEKLDKYAERLWGKE